MGRRWIMVAGLSVLFGVSQEVMASQGGPASFNRDTTYEQNLRYQSSADQIITPGRVIRWLFNHQSAAAPKGTTNAEFQPIVNVKDSKVRVVAAVAITF